MSADDLAMASFGFTAMKVILFWLFCAFLAAGFGARRGQGPSSFVLGLLLGPFGVLAAYFSAGTYVRCHRCQELRHPKASVCPHCAQALPGGEG